MGNPRRYYEVVEPPPADRSGFVIVRLVDALARVAGDDLTAARAEDARLQPLVEVVDRFNLDPPLRALGAEGRKFAERTEPSLGARPSLSAYWRFDARGRDAIISEVLRALRRLDAVDLAYLEWKMSTPSTGASEPFADYQEYKDRAPKGVGAVWAVANRPAADGSGIQLADVEVEWNRNHQDVPQTGTLTGTVNTGDHGTAVLGVVAAPANDLGIVGIAPGVRQVWLASYDYGSAGENVGAAIIEARYKLESGDVMLLEVQIGVSSRLLPVEADVFIFEAIELVAATGVVVIEAGGNGGEDLDMLGIFNPSSPVFGDSGAILVAASEWDAAAEEHRRAGLSNFGSRFDCFSWGSRIFTCSGAYGRVYPNTSVSVNRQYCDGFDGTSGASAILAGVALAVQSHRAAAAEGRLLWPWAMRAVLGSPLLGTRQSASGPPGRIASMPDLEKILGPDGIVLRSDAYLRAEVGDVGERSGRPPAACPDLILTTEPIVDPPARLGRGSGNENRMPLGPYRQGSGEHQIYARLCGRGSRHALIDLDIYWARPATLLTPDRWNPIGTLSALRMEGGDAMLVAGPLPWVGAAEGAGYYALAGVLHGDGDPELSVPDMQFRLRDYAAAFMHNNWAYRNHYLLEVPDLLDQALDFSFDVTGAPDADDQFELVIERDLPPETDLELEVPIDVGQPWSSIPNVEVSVNQSSGLARVTLAPIPSLRLPVDLAKGATHPARLRLRSGHPLGASNSVLVRQLSEGNEVGRLSWGFAPTGSWISEKTPGGETMDDDICKLVWGRAATVD